ncbi:hypothetical protein PFAG_04991 [Plasmodium falciparum Santa Lucia]|uniref:Uncharacterized protein n=15 Tax=Plasmodium falciparum TaxID=5833 RepID=A0A5K1K954_PLAF7|nr:conserved Plasmodium protein, unknown function [Plasmodium falciparum 3D7]ETW16562.1 hypothetical protein PFFVO_04528 [Plasmodium falciparum Vietnam Oak-Knoll (FVO)]ETW27276.1 hypothetical protein PFFCH_05302 [Plasmodium falciparum FCH/4]ETW34440.1 hypothetical protein PFTANZ_04863 [Plasmodium falciparum Tanzania (2000708)]ETW40799.1 hypothetical protein PFNF135_05101 [Plasmodium falciparum NF135/5.C10]ETW55423.1 hypothetical protein PFUGPA_02582 [Plasmodium falciparum Palo Alto/Uganda]ETW|eukprot:XP_001350348.1 conserved Plasmodium protein, unknown function [Plasmodium falciparum 3D7]
MEESILIKNFHKLDNVCNSLIDILKNLKELLFHLDPLNKYEQDNDDSSLFLDMKDSKNYIIILSDIIHKNVNKIMMILYEFIKTIPPSYTYYSSFSYKDYVILQEMKEIKKYNDENNQIKNDIIYDRNNVTTSMEAHNADNNQSNIHHEHTKNDNIYNNNDVFERYSENSNDHHINNNYDNNMSHVINPQNINEYFYYSFLIDIEYSNLLHMKKYEEEIKEYLSCII